MPSWLAPEIGWKCDGLKDTDLVNEDTNQAETSRRE
jgi:hypothetical protein